MGTKRGGEGRRLKARRRGLSIESLERRALLATASETFVGPSLSGLIAQAEKGKNTTPAQINTMVDALQSQLQSGPLADLNSGAVTGNGFIAEAQSLEASYELDVDQQLAAKFPNNDEILKLQGQRVVANLIALNQENAVALISGPALATSSRATIASLSAGPIIAVGTKPGAITAATKALKTNLYSLEDGLGNSTLTLPQVITTLGAEAEAYRADIHAGIQLTQLRISGEADTLINALESSTIATAPDVSSTAQSQLSTAINTFDAAVLNTKGLFAPHGALSRSKNARLRPGTTNGQAASMFGVVSGTSTSSSTNTLTATLTSSDGSPLMGESVGFTVAGAFAGVAVTNFTGVATLPGVTAAAIGTSGVVAHFASDTNFLSTSAGGNLVVSGVATTVSQVSGTSTFGGPATLSATLTSTTSGQGLAGRTLNFILDGLSVGSAQTNGVGVATLPGVTTADSAGTDAGGLVVNFAGQGNEASSAGNGNLVVSGASTSLSNVGGTASFGGTATLTATLTSAATGQGVVGQTVAFTRNGVSLGVGITGSGGLATLLGVVTTDGVGTVAGGVTASFVGNTNYFAAPSVSGNLVVGQANTALANVGGTALVGGTATLTATLTSTANSQPISGQMVSFTLGGTAVGSAVTNSSGLATLNGVATTSGAGTDAGVVVATFAGGVDYASTLTTGDLVVSKAGTSLAGVGGTSSFGGPATLTATLTSMATGTGISGETVDFNLSGTSVGSATTNSSGVATLTGVAANDAVGTLTGAVVANFAGDANNAVSPSGTGNLVITPAATALGSISGTATFGGPATLKATLTSNVTSQGIAGETVVFTLGGMAVGSSLTDSGGVATLTGVATTAAVGTEAGAVAASFSGDANYAAATKATGDLVVGKATTALGGVSGTASFGGPATLTATLTSSATAQGVSGQTISFTLGGTSVGTALTNGQGVATLTGVATTAGAGTAAGVVAASFAGAANYSAANAAGDLVVSQAGTTLGGVAGTASLGGTATLTATLTSSATGKPISGEIVNFTLGGTSVGTALTNAQGVATLTGVATTAGVGTAAGVVAAGFAGAPNYSAAKATGDLVVGKAGSVLGSVSGVDTFGGPATLKATLTSPTTGQPLAGEIVSFTLGGTSVGTALTNAQGVATLTGVATTAGAGTAAGAVVASFAGDANHFAAANATGDLVVSQAITALGNISGVATFGGPATLTATLTSTATGAGLPGQTVSFTLRGTVVGTAVTNINGVATLSGVATSAGVGTYTGGVIASFAGTSNYSAVGGFGDLVVSQAPTVLSNVSGTATFGGPTTLKATLTSSVTSKPIAGESVSFFTQSNSLIGTAVTDANGVATLSGVVTTDPIGTFPGAVLAKFTGDTNYVASNGSGDLVVSRASTDFVGVSGSAHVGGPVTLSAMLISSVTNLGIPGETVFFTLDGNSVGSAITDNNGIATLQAIDPKTGVAGVYPGVVTAFFPGTAQYVSSMRTGDLTVS